MPAIQSKLDTSSEAFEGNRKRMLELVAKFRALEQRTRDKSEAAKPLFDKRGQVDRPNGTSLSHRHGFGGVGAGGHAGWQADMRMIEHLLAHRNALVILLIQAIARHD